MARDALVIGASLAGLVAAQRLAQRGLSVGVLEACAEPGGAHAPYVLEGHSYCARPQLVPSVAPGLVALARELGVALERLPLGPVQLLRRGRAELRATSLRAALGHSPLALLRLRRIAQLAHWLSAELDPLAQAGATRLDDRSAADFARVYLGRRALSEWVAPLSAVHALGDAEDASRQPLFAALDARGELAQERVRGLEQLVPALTRGAVELRTSARVKRLRVDGSGVQLENGEEIAARAIVLAVSARAAAELLPERSPAERVAFERIHERDAALLAVAGADLPSLAWVSAREEGALAGCIEAVPGLHLLVSRSSAAAALDLEARLLADAARFGLRNARARTLHRLRVSTFGVGQLRAVARLRAEAAARPTRRIFLAGEWMSSPNTEAALQSGERAARELFASL